MQQFFLLFCGHSRLISCSLCCHLQLEERIGRLSAELAEQKPVMILHAARIHRIESVLLQSSTGQGLGQAILSRPPELQLITPH